MNRQLRRGVTLLLAAFPALGWAEGSKQLTPNTNPNEPLTSAANTRAGFLTHDVTTDNASLGFLKPATWTGSAGTIPFSEDYRMYVHMEPGETLFYGVHRSVRTGSTSTQADLELTLRYGGIPGTVAKTSVLAREQSSANQTLLQAGNGVINTADEAFAGPLPNAGGYSPLQYTNTTGSAQDFYIEFTQTGEAALSDDAKRSEYDFWDFTVRTGAGVEKPGRLFSKHWAFSAGTSSGADPYLNRLSATFNLYPLVESKKTPGQYFVKQVELAGLRPLVFYFVSNEFGSTYDATTRATVAQRQRSQTTRTSYPQYPNFVNEPDAAVYPSAAIPTVSTSAVAFCNAGVTQVAFTTRSDETGAFDILIDLNGNGVNDGADVLLQQFVTGGTSNTIVWNGRDKNNAAVNPTGQIIKYNFVSKGATVNFPVFDAEGNPDGFRVRNARPGNAAYDLLYWDDTNLTNFATRGVQLTGLDSTPGVHIWGNGNNEGNSYTVNSWTYGFTVFTGAKTFTYISACDNDNDGVDNLADIDDDNDGVLDAVESFSPTGVASTNASYVDPSAFTTGAAVPHYLDVAYMHPVLGAFRDANSDGINDIFDIDQDGIPNHYDLDADGDGLTDAFEANGNSNPTYTFGPVSTPVRGVTYIHESHFDATLGQYTTTAAASATASGATAGVGDNGLPDAVETSVAYSTTGNGANTRLLTTETGVSKYTLADADGDQRSVTTGGTTFISVAYNNLDIDSDNDGITDNREAQATLTYRAPSGVDTDQDGIDNAYDPTPGPGQTAGVALVAVINSDGDATPDMFDTDSDNDNAGKAALLIYQQTADWAEGFDTSGNGFSGDEIVAKARAFVLGNPEKASYYVANSGFGSTTSSPFLLLSKTVAGNKIPAFLDPASAYYHDDNFNGLVDLYDPAYGGTPSTAPKNTAGEYIFRANGAQTPLPVELKAFAATAVKNIDAALTWTTASEKNNDHFDVERSFNGAGFVKIAQVKGQGTTSAGTDYALTDAGIGRNAADLVYYRLKQVDADGTSSYSPVRTVAFAGGAGLEPAIALLPNPTSSATSLDLTALPAGTYQVSVLDAMGRTVLQVSREAGLSQALNLSTVASGTYIVLVRGQNGGQILSLSKRLIKE